VEIEAVPARMARPESGGREREQLRGRATPAHRRARPLSKCPPTLHGSGRDGGEYSSRTLPSSSPLPSR
jgi:hypothetical protein